MVVFSSFSVLTIVRLRRRGYDRQTKWWPLVGKISTTPNHHYKKQETKNAWNSFLRFFFLSNFFQYRSLTRMIWKIIFSQLYRYNAVTCFFFSISFLIRSLIYIYSIYLNNIFVRLEVPINVCLCVYMKIDKKKNVVKYV